MPKRRRSDFPVFDADNHMYETTDAFTKFLPTEYGASSSTSRSTAGPRSPSARSISEYIPNPTFEVVAGPGPRRSTSRSGNPEGKSRRELMGEPIRLTRGLLLSPSRGSSSWTSWASTAPSCGRRWPACSRSAWPTTRPATHAVVHALNQWMHEHWTFNYEDRIFPTPVITLPIVDEAIKELEWVSSGAPRIVLIRPAPGSGLHGAPVVRAPRVRPLLAAVAEADIPVGMHASDSGYHRYYNEWEGDATARYLPFEGGSAFVDIAHGQAGPSSTRWRRSSATGVLTGSRRCGSCPSRTERLGAPAARRPGHAYTSATRTCSTRTR